MAAWALTGRQWVILALIIAFYLLLCARTALSMARTGRNFWKWLILTVCLTSIPASLVMLNEQRKAHAVGPHTRRRRAKDDAEDHPEGDAVGHAMVKCARCGRRFDAAQAGTSGGLPTCPSCGLPLDQETLA